MLFYKNLELAISTSDINVKKELTITCLKNCTENEIDTSFDIDKKVFEIPSFAQKCTIVESKMVPPRKNLDTKNGLATLIHSIAHIEYSAIDLALDAVYRFRDMSIEYKIDWLEVALDEIRHFEMLESLLVEVDCKYGDFPVHQGLFDAAMRTTSSALERMAIIPRYFEASGLDVNPQIISKLKNTKQNNTIKKLIQTLEVILKEEVSHVYKGDKWFKYLCTNDSLGYDVFFDILDKYGLLNRHRAHINERDRISAGFSCKEVIRLGGKDCK